MNTSGSQAQQPRRVKALVSILGTTQMHLRNPYIIALWSAMFPGLGHLLLSKYIRGFLLFGWEVVINLQSHMNECIFYSFTLQFDMAKQVLDIRWLILYIPTYLFSIWDSFRTTVDLNNQFVLASREGAEVKPFTVHPLGINYLDKGSPWTAFAWSIITPGVGQLVIHRIVVAFFLIICWIGVVYFSKLLPAIHYSLWGQFELARAIANHQWLLNIPSLYFFAAYDAYINTVESNKLFNWEQAQHLKRDYQSQSFTLPLLNKNRKGDKMYIVSTFEHSIKLESAITAIEMKGIPKEDILAVPLDKNNEKRKIFDSMHYSDHLSMLDVPILLATVFALFGLIYGFLLYWSPVIWALIGAAFGTVTGILFKLYTTRKHRAKKMAEEPAVVLMIACKENQMDMVQDTLWTNCALGVSQLKFEDKI